MAFLAKTTTLPPITSVTPSAFLANNESVELSALKIESFEFVSFNEITIYGSPEVRTQLFTVANAYLKV